MIITERKLHLLFLLLLTCSAIVGCTRQLDTKLRVDDFVGIGLNMRYTMVNSRLARLLTWESRLNRVTSR